MMMIKILIIQAGSSFDLPDMMTLSRVRSQQESNTWDDEHKYSCVLFDTEDGKTTSKASRLVKADPENSSNENIRYQAMDIITKVFLVSMEENFTIWDSKAYD